MSVQEHRDESQQRRMKSIKGMNLIGFAPLVDRLDDLLRRILILGHPLGLAQREVKV